MSHIPTDDYQKLRALAHEHQLRQFDSVIGSHEISVGKISIGEKYWTLKQLLGHVSSDEAKEEMSKL